MWLKPHISSGLQLTFVWMVRVLFESIIYFCAIKLTSLDFLEVQPLDASPSFVSTTVRLLNVFKNCPLCVLQKNLSVAKNEILLCCRKVSTFILIEGIEILEEEDSSLAAKLFLIEKFFSFIFCNFRGKNRSEWCFKFGKFLVHEDRNKQKW